MAPADEPFLGRWSRLKRERRRDEPAPVDVQDVEDAEPAQPASGPATGDETAEPLDLPDIDTLDKDSDYSVFMKEGVPEALKKLALRKLWLSDPDLAVLDGLNDYDEDFRIPEAILGEIAKGGDETPDDPGDDAVGAKAEEKEKEKEKEDEVAAAKGAGEPEVSAADSRQEDAPAVDAEADDAPGDAAKDGDEKSG
jgi:hypothetical protein